PYGATPAQSSRNAWSEQLRLRAGLLCSLLRSVERDPRCLLRVVERLLRGLLAGMERSPVGLLLVVQRLRGGLLRIVERRQLGLGCVRLRCLDVRQIGRLLRLE